MNILKWMWKILPIMLLAVNVTMMTIAEREKGHLLLK